MIPAFKMLRKTGLIARYRPPTRSKNPIRMLVDATVSVELIADIVDDAKL